MDIVNYLNSAAFLNTVLILLAFIGGFFAFRSGKRNETVKLQKENNDALLTRIEVLSQKIVDLEKENHLQQHVLDTIISALKQRGMAVTIDGDMVSIENIHTGSSMHRKRTITTTQAVVKKEEE
jgi:hypothetical protein